MASISLTLIRSTIRRPRDVDQVSIATADGATIRARPLPGAAWGVGDGVFVRDGVIVDDAPALESTTQYV